MSSWRDPVLLDEIEAWLRQQTTREAAHSALDHWAQFPDQEGDQLFSDAEQLAIRLCRSEGNREGILGAPDEEEILASLKVFPVRELAFLLGLAMIQDMRRNLALVAEFQLDIELETFSDLHALAHLLEAAGKMRPIALAEVAASLEADGEAPH